MLIPWDSVEVDIYPPYDHVLLAFLSCIAIKCPKCGETYFRRQIGMITHTDHTQCLKCNFTGQFLHWYSSLGIFN